MKRMLAIKVAVIAWMTLMVGCSAGPAVCPEMGIITGVEDPVSPKEAPNFTWQVIDCQTLQTVGGKTGSLRDFRGRPVMVIFNKSQGCPECNEQMPYVQAVYEAQENTGLAVLTIYRDDNSRNVRRCVTSRGWDVFPALADPKDQVASKYGFGPGAPMTVFIDASGTIKEQKIQGPFESEDEIEDILDSL